MIKIKLAANDFNILAMTAEKTECIEILRGKYNNKNYSAIIFSNNAIILEGDEDMVLRSDVVAVNVTVKSVEHKVAEFLADNNVYLLGIDAIPEGKERSVLAQLI